MARWSDLSYNAYYSRNDEINREVEDDFNAFLFEVSDEFRLVDDFGLIEDVNVDNCYGVEDVYNNLDEWN